MSSAIAGFCAASGHRGDATLATRQSIDSRTEAPIVGLSKCQPTRRETRILGQKRRRTVLKHLENRGYHKYLS
ncbi:hypothetical protein CC86DRAFT_369890 [Ophiobolus disseminans]|uniref:Uncharacterized protein n=1 Tax=Ophiobolus disseminans TaxID=1469910 RepID=A0A6A7A0T6_9PLEO|nr:hypothetical protein CC86DRAFT_369890 [Ophiobolus disseminans]